MSENRSRHFRGLRRPRPDRSTRGGGALVILLAVVFVLGLVFVGLLFMPAVPAPREATRRATCANNLKQIALALQNYEAVHHEFPPAYTTDANGKPLHSWRTLILPYIEEQAMYDTIDLTKPWDDPANAILLRTRLPVYQCPSTTNDDNLTTYLAVVTLNSCLQSAEPRKRSDVTDLASQTLMVIEVSGERAVPWMSPEDAAEDDVLRFGRQEERRHPGGAHGVFLDGSVQFLSDDMPAAERIELISIAGTDNAR